MSSLEALSAYIPQDRREAIATGTEIPRQMHGSVLWADISGFTHLTETLVARFGPRHGADELGLYLNQVYDALIEPVSAWGGSVVDFSGDAITCWFNSDDGRAIAAAQTMQMAMQSFNNLQPVTGERISFGVKIAIASGAVQRYQVGDPTIQWLDTMAGITINRLALLGNLAKPGEILLDEVTATRQRIAEWHSDPQTGGRFATLHPPFASPTSAPRSFTLIDEQIRPWLLPAVFARIQNGQGDFLTELRPAVALFLRFDGLDYDHAQVGEKLDTVIRTAQRILAQYNGTLLQLTIGDKGSYLYAAFGAPVAHEDDTLRALNAALDLRQMSINGVASVSIGLSRGLMRTGGYGATKRRTYGVIGDDVNLAARLMQQAGPGQILASSSIWQDAAPHFDWLALPSLHIKGKHAPIYPAELRGRHQQSSAFPEISTTLPMIGRQAERALMEEKLALARLGRGQIVNIVGEAGAGKSRLLAEIIRRAGNHTRYGGECQSYGTHSAYLVWQPIWRAFFGLDSTAPTADQLRGIEKSLQQINPDFLIRLPLLGAAINIDIPDNGLTTGMDAKARKTLRESLLVDCIRTWAGASPLILILEDLHWADPLSLDLIEIIGRVIESLPVLILLTHRPQASNDTATFLPTLDKLAHFTNIRLMELNHSETEELIFSRLNNFGLGGAISQKLVERLSARTQGNPFYIEELLNYLHDRGIDPRDESVWVQSDLPDSLHSLILSRIDQLSEHEQITIKAASIIGRLFQASWLYAYYPLLSEIQVTDDLKNLSHLDLLIQDAPEPQLAYLFKHVITQEVAYESLAYSTRANLHEQLANYLEQLAGEEVHPYLDLLAYHYEHSNNLPKKREYLYKAGEAAQKAYANDAAITYLSKALALTPEDNYAERFEILFARQDVYSIIMKREAENEDLIALATLADALEDNARRAKVALRRSNYAYFTGKYQEASDAGKLAVKLAHLAKAYDDEIIAYTRWSDALIRLGHITKSYRCDKKALALAEKIQNTNLIALCLISVGSRFMDDGNLDKAQAYYTRALSLYKENGHKRNEPVVLYSLGNLNSYYDLAKSQSYYEQALKSWQAMGDRRFEGVALSQFAYLIGERRNSDTKAKQYCEQALQLSIETFDRLGEMCAFHSMGVLYLADNNYELARLHIQQALDICLEISYPLYTGVCLTRLGTIFCQLGNFTQAREHFAKGIHILQNSLNIHELVQGLTMQGVLHFHSKDYITAQKIYQEVLTIAKKSKNRLEYVHALVLRGHLLTELNNLTQAAASYREGLSLALELGLDHYAKQAQTGLAWVSFAQGRSSEALTSLDEILEYLATHRLSTIDEVAWIYLTCYRMLQALADPRAHPTIEAAYSFLQAIATRINDPSLSVSFLQNVGFNREIVETWENLTAVE